MNVRITNNDVFHQELALADVGVCSVKERREHIRIFKNTFGTPPTLEELLAQVNLPNSLLNTVFSNNEDKEENDDDDFDTECEFDGEEDYD